MKGRRRGEEDKGQTFKSDKFYSYAQHMVRKKITEMFYIQNRIK